MVIGHQATATTVHQDVRLHDDNGSDVQVNWSTTGCGKLQTRQGQQWVCDDRVEVDHQVLDKSMALSGALCAEGCYATLPNTVMVPQH